MQDLSTLWAVVFAAALVLGVLLKLYLSWRQARHVWQHRGQVPAAFAQAITLQAHQ
jgi:STE24 endopeptidase